MSESGSSQAGDTRAIALVSGKGGSGKTIVASVLARVLSSPGEFAKRVLLIDADAGTAGLSYFLAIKQVTNISKGLLELASDSLQGGRESESDEKRPHARSDASAAEPDLTRSVLPIQVQQMKDIKGTSFLCIGDHRRRFRDSDDSACARGVERAIRDLRDLGEWGWIIVDCRGGSDVHSRTVCEAVDDILLVAEPDTTSFQATQHLVDELTAADLSQKLCGFIINKQFDDPQQLSLNASGAFRCRYLGSVPFDFAATRSFLVGNIPSQSSPFGVHVWSAAHKLYPDAVPTPAGRVWSRADFREIGVSNRDSVRGGALLSVIFMWTTLAYFFIEMTEFVSVGPYRFVQWLLVPGALLLGILGSLEPVRRSLGRAVTLYWEVILKLVGKRAE